MGLKVGDYVRTKDGNINKIIQVEYMTPYNAKHQFIYLTDNLEKIWYPEDEIIKSSTNIIDLIEVGDYVNGYKVIGAYSPEGTYVLWIKLSCNPIDNWKNEDIKSIVTKEQFESIKYRIESEVN